MSETKMGGAWSLFFGLLTAVSAVILNNAMNAVGFVIPFLDWIMLIIVYFAFIRSQKGSLLLYFMGYFPTWFLLTNFFAWTFPGGLF